MHKGYAFVQFANPFDARSACLGEDGRTISGQVVGKQGCAHTVTIEFRRSLLDQWFRRRSDWPATKLKTE